MGVARCMTGAAELVVQRAFSSEGGRPQVGAIGSTRNRIRGLVEADNSLLHLPCSCLAKRYIARRNLG
jgi:hypothetical protein